MTFLQSNGAAGAIASGSTTATTTYLWDKDPDMDDPLHNFDPVRDRDLESIDFFSLRGWINASALFVILGGILMLFAGYPVYDAVKNKLQYTHESSVETSLPDMGLPTLVDSATPDSAKTRTGSDGKTYNLVFSDEFEVDGRTFYPAGDDPYWEGVDLYYWPTGDLEWYDPGAMTTKNGKLQITITEELTHNLNFKSGMLQSWNKICFLTGYLEVSISMPGTPKAPGFWPGAWTMANLGRAGYGATTDGMWPYTYDSCDLGTFPNQTTKDLEPAAALTGSEYGGAISYLPGQKLSACTCPDSDHPGPSNGTNGYVGRGVPEVDILEAQVDVASGWRGEVSQSLQIAPFDLKYEFVNSTPATTISNDTISFFNSYKGDEWQEACSVVSYITDEVYNDTAYATYGYEWWSDPDNRDDGYIAWYSMGTETWKATAATIGPNNKSEVSQRLIPEEPMYVILNLGMAPSFEKQDFKHLQFPSTMYIDYVRIYQRDDVENGLTCDPTNRPTTQYIADHATAYNDANLTTWADAGYTFPRNWMYDGC
ncbi:glycoside hydrolase family 16 protein [Fistulina hepatica ATCC 64428]|uniref:Glycoside hydrolase family 16 protein n=1 Tax=Fistulina hepatica ATCC 64428 TaxID=1128425 RepID=A0A0D7A2Z5_9AGAR|nr:glycoside hydrolase family 16 protein [Fistulina hepatica ATCC 64428]